ncbi:MAG: amidohydrolase family protein [Acidobacteriota bacterium]
MSQSHRHTLLVLTLLAFAGLPIGLAQEPELDLAIRGGRVLDGTGNPWFRADVGIRDGRIVEIRRSGELGPAREEIDVDGAIVAPGFIDLHSHADDFNGANGGLRSPDVARRRAENIVTQGVTTIVVNPDGSGPPISIADQRKQLEDPGVGVNVALMAAHNTIRLLAMGADHRRAATPEEITKMQNAVRAALGEGAFGLTSGLEYVPGRWSATEELVALMDAASDLGAVHISHIRSETSAPMWWVPSQDLPKPPQLLDAYREIIEIAERTGTVGVMTHMKVRGTTHWGQSKEVIELVEAARSRGVEVYGDQYPYASSGSDGALVLIPAWARTRPDGATSDADPAVLLELTLEDPELTETVRADISHALAFRGGAERIVVFDYPDESFIGQSLAELAAVRSIDAESMAIALQLEGYRDRPGGARLRSFSLAEEDMQKLMARPWVATASDGGVALPEDGPTVHARYWGTFPRKIGRYVREQGAVSLEHAVRAGTSLPARILGLEDRGTVRVGALADLVVFDPETIGDNSTFMKPHQASSGVLHVLIGGRAAVRDGRATGELIGSVLARPGSSEGD